MILDKDLSVITDKSETTENLGHVHFDNNKLVATNRNVLVVQDLSLYDCTELQAQTLHGKSMHGMAFRMLKNSIHLDVEGDFIISHGVFQCHYKLTRNLQCPFVNYDILFSENHEIVELGINPKLLDVIMKVTKSESKQFRFDFFGRNKPIKVTALDLSDEQEYFVLMPIDLDK